MNQITASESRVELPRQITPEPSIDKIIEIFPGDDRVLAPRARIVLAKCQIDRPSYALKRASCHYLLQKLLCSISTSQRHCWRLKYSASGAPALASGEDLFISMSRSGEWLAAGVSYGAGIGVDIECIRPRKNFSATADILNWSITVKNIRDFYAKWTLWEASAKCVKGSVLMSKNPGFDRLCNVDTRDRVGRSGQWSGLHNCLDDKVFYAVVLRSENKTDLRHQFLCPEKTVPWSVSNSHHSA